MPTLHSLSIRRRGTTPVKSSAPPTTTTHTIKGFFHRSKTTDSGSRKSIEKTLSNMGNAPSDMNGNGTAGTPKQRALSTSDRDSVRSRAMPGAEPPTPTPASEASISKEEGQTSPEPDTTQVQSYDTDSVPHVLNNFSFEDDAARATEERDLEARMVTAVGILVEEPETMHQQQADAVEKSEKDAIADAARTPRAEPRTEEALAPLDLGSLPPHHAPEGSDATAVSVSPARAPGTPPIWTPGTYVLLNAKGGTAMDLSGADNKMIIGYPMHGGPNQQWEFVPCGHGYLIRSVRRSSDGHSLYLSTDNVRHGAPIVASPYPVAWNVEQTEDGIRIMWPMSKFYFDLADYGNSAAGTKIQLAERRPELPCQQWHFTRCAPAADTEREKDMSVEARSARAVSPPATTETVTITEERDFVTTTRTTTTTIITSVTETTRTPKSMFRQSQPQRRSIAYR